MKIKLTTEHRTEDSNDFIFVTATHADNDALIIEFAIDHNCNSICAENLDDLALTLPVLNTAHFMILASKALIDATVEETYVPMHVEEAFFDLL